MIDRGLCIGCGVTVYGDGGRAWVICEDCRAAACGGSTPPARPCYTGAAVVADNGGTARGPGGASLRARKRQPMAQSADRETQGERPAAGRVAAD